MPFSNCEQITPILTEIRSIRPQSVLDVGCGLGLYGFLCRIYLDLYDDASFLNKLNNNQSSWQMRIDGIEGTPIYIPFIPNWVYNEIHCGEALEILTNIANQTYDLVLALAILEHFAPEQGKEFVRQLQRVGRNVIISLPKNVLPQEIPGCPYETHRSQWSEEELRNLGFQRFLPHFGAWIAIYQK